MVVVIPALGGGDIRIKSSSPPCSDSQFEQANLESKRLILGGWGERQEQMADRWSHLCLGLILMLLRG